MKSLIALLALFFSVHAFAITIPEGFTQETVKLHGVTLNV